MIRVVVQDENGKVVSQAVDVSSAVIARPDDPRFACLRFVDPYGDTVFNRLQLAALLEDLRLLKGSSNGGQHEAVFRQIEALVERCQAEPHLYLKLVGD
jgi:hypothetical protein